MFKPIFLLFVLFSAAYSPHLSAQNKPFTSQLYETYENYKEASLQHRRIKYSDLQPLINKLKSNPKYVISKVGTSVQGRDLQLISIGKGQTQIFLWSQMHGNEPTATQAIFDIINFFNSNQFQTEKKEILNRVSIHFLPMLNPDGAQVYQRRNALDIDINRDAVRLQSPEAQTLKRVRDSLQADFGFNLHDQSIYYNAERTHKPATISYLAPAYNYDKDINTVRANAMKIIVYMNRIIQKYAKGQVGRYNDDFEPRAFGDNIQKWGTSTILIESGGYQNDVEKQEIRKLNYVSILSAIYAIANEGFKNIAVDDYEKIPHNDRKLFDLKLEKVTYTLDNKNYSMDIGINRTEIDNATHSNFYDLGKVDDVGDLSTYYGYEELDASNYTLVAGKVYPKRFKSIKDLASLNIYTLLQSGYTYIRVKKLPKGQKYWNKPIILIGKKRPIRPFELKIGHKATFLLKSDNQIKFAVINGFLIDLSKSKNNFNNALILR